MTDSVAQDMLQSYYRRWRALEDRRAEVVEDLRQLFIETKSTGFDGKALRVAFRRVLDSEDAEKAGEIAERDATVDLYVAAIVGTPVATRAHRAPEAGDTKSGTAENRQGASSEPGADEGSQQIQESGADTRAGAKTATSSTAARKDVQERPIAKPSLTTASGNGDSSSGEGETTAVAGTQVPPVEATPQATNKPAESVKPSAAPVFVRDRKPLRPYCQRPERGCAGQGAHHFFTCKKAALAEGKEIA